MARGRILSPELASYLTLGIQLALAVVAFFFVGRWLDAELGTAPWLMIAGLLLGTAGGFIKFFRTALRLGRAADREAHREGPKDGSAG